VQDELPQHPAADRREDRLRERDAVRADGHKGHRAGARATMLSGNSRATMLSGNSRATMLSGNSRATMRDAHSHVPCSSSRASWWRTCTCSRAVTSASPPARVTSPTHMTYAHPARVSPVLRRCGQRRAQSRFRCGRGRAQSCTDVGRGGPSAVPFNGQKFRVPLRLPLRTQTRMALRCGRCSQ
jgi:hypothetical protein